jgi:hypothetical protein
MRKKITTEEIIERAIKVHGNKYDYSLVKYVNYKTKIKIICLKHGEFKKTIYNHINNKQGCPICGNSCKYKKVYCKELDQEFECVHCAARYLSIHQSNITACCKGRGNYTGRHPNNSNIKLTWKYI